MSISNLVSVCALCCILITTGAVIAGTSDTRTMQLDHELGLDVTTPSAYTASIGSLAMSSAPIRTLGDHHNQESNMQTLAMMTTSSSTMNANQTAVSQQNNTELTVDGELAVRRPPANTVINHELTLSFNSSIQNGTIILFNRTYNPEMVQINSVGTAKNTEHVTADVITVNGSDTINTSVQLTAIRLQTEGNNTAQTITIDADIRHPDITTVEEYQLTVSTTQVSSATSVARYQVRPIGSDRRSGLTTEFDRTDGTGFVYANATVYQGERDIQFRGSLAEQLVSVGGDNEGVIIQPPIQTDTDTGVYSVDGTNATGLIRVSQPEITTLRLENYRGSDVTDGRINPEKTEMVTVTGQSNFEDAEKLELAVTNDNGVDITDELIDTDRVRAETTDGAPISVQSQTGSDMQQRTHHISESSTAQPHKARQPTQSPSQCNCHYQSTIQNQYLIQNREAYSDVLTKDHTSRKRTIDTANGVNEGISKYITFNDDVSQTSPSHREHASPMQDGRLLSDQLQAQTQAQAQVQSQGRPSPQRNINKTDIQPGDTVTVSVNATVGSDDAFSIAETFTPTVESANITSIDTGDVSKNPFVAAATSTGVVVSFQDVPEGTPINITYKIKTKLSPETYQITGTVDTTDRQIEIGETEFVAGTGGSRSSVVSGGKVRWQLDTDVLQTSTATIKLTGSDDLISGAARSTAKLRISRDPVSLSLDSARLTRGENTDIAINNGVYGKTYTIGIKVSEINDIPDRSDYYSIFRDVGTTKSVGVITDNGDIFTDGERIIGNPATIFARVQVDPEDGTGVTGIRSGNLEQSTTIELFNRRPGNVDPNVSRSASDETILTTVDPTATLSGPDEYISGSETTIRGRTAAGIDTVLMYVESDSAFELVDLDGESDGNYSGIIVSGGDFTHETTLSIGDASGNQLLSLPGEYQVAIRSKSSVRSDQSIPQRLSKSAMLSEATSLHTIHVRNQTVTVTAPGIGGTVADTKDTIQVSGTVNGSDNALLIAIGERGEVESKIVNGKTFDNVTLQSGSFSNGALTLYAITTGRDNRIGDGQIPTATSRSTSAKSGLNSLQSHIESVSEQRAYTGGQIRTVLRSETDLDTASDDPVVKRTARVVPAAITIGRPAQGTTIPNDEPLTIAGTTTVSPTNTHMSIIISGDNRSLRSLRVQQWNSTWSVNVEMTNLTSGTYYIDVSIDDVSSERKILLTDMRSSTPTPTPISTIATPIPDDESGTGVGMDITADTQSKKVSEKSTMTPQSPSQLSESNNTTTTRPRVNHSPEPMQTITQGFTMAHAAGMGVTVAVIILFLLQRGL